MADRWIFIMVETVFILFYIIGPEILCVPIHCEPQFYYDSVTKNCHSCTDCCPPRPANTYCERECDFTSACRKNVGNTNEPDNNKPVIIGAVIGIIVIIIIAIVIYISFRYIRRRGRRRRRRNTRPEILNGDVINNQVDYNNNNGCIGTNPIPNNVAHNSIHNETANDAVSPTAAANRSSFDPEINPNPDNFIAINNNNSNNNNINNNNNNNSNNNNINNNNNNNSNNNNINNNNNNNDHSNVDNNDNDRDTSDLMPSLETQEPHISIIHVSTTENVSKIPVGYDRGHDRGYKSMPVCIQLSNYATSSKGNPVVCEGEYSEQTQVIAGSNNAEQEEYVHTDSEMYNNHSRKKNSINLKNNTRKINNSSNENARLATNCKSNNSNVMSNDKRNNDGDDEEDTLLKKPWVNYK